MNSLLPELGEYAATEFHPLQRLLRDLHVLVDGVHAGLDLFELFCARTRGMIIFAGRIYHIEHRSLPACMLQPASDTGDFNVTA